MTTFNDRLVEFLLEVELPPTLRDTAPALTRVQAEALGALLISKGMVADPAELLTARSRIQKALDQIVAMHIPPPLPPEVKTRADFDRFMRDALEGVCAFIGADLTGGPAPVYAEAESGEPC